MAFLAETLVLRPRNPEMTFPLTQFVDITTGGTPDFSTPAGTSEISVLADTQVAPTVPTSDSVSGVVRYSSVDAWYLLDDFDVSAGRWISKVTFYWYGNDTNASHSWTAAVRANMSINTTAGSLVVASGLGAGGSLVGDAWRSDSLVIAKDHAINKPVSINNWGVNFAIFDNAAGIGTLTVRSLQVHVELDMDNNMRSIV